MQIVMQIDRETIIKEGLSFIGSQTSDLFIKEVVFQLRFDSTTLWLTPFINISKINGFHQEIPLPAHQQYEVDVSTGPKVFIIQDVRVEFSVQQKVQKRIRLNLIQSQTVPVSKTVTPVKQRSRHTKNLVLEYANSLTEFKVKLSNCSINQEEKVLLFQLGIEITEENDYNILVMNAYKRTMNLLLALNQGKLIVSSKWLQSVMSNRYMENPYQYLLKTKHGLHASMQRAMTSRVFKDSNFKCSPNLPVNVRELIISGGGQISDNGIEIVPNGSKGFQLEQLLQAIVLQRL